MTPPLPCQVAEHRFALHTVAGDNLSNRVSRGQIWERHVSLALRQFLGAGMTMIDVGANVGYYTVLGSRLVAPGGRVIAVEPHRPLQQILVRNCGINGCANVTLDVRAVGKDNSRGAVISPAGDSGTTHLELGDGPGGVELVGLDRLCRELDAVPDIVKIDVEGLEPDVIAGASDLLANAGPGLFVEFAPHMHDRAATTLDQAVAILSECRYHPYLFRGHDDASIEPVSWGLLLEIARYWARIGHRGHWDMFAARKLMTK